MSWFGRPPPFEPERLHEAICADCHIETDGWAADRIRAACAALEKVLPRGLRPRVTLLWLAQPTAFTIPGQYVYVTRELLSSGLSEGGVAFVIAHELAHHQLGHLRPAEKLLRRLGAGTLGTVLAAVVSEVSCKRRGSSREIDADLQALEWILKAGYGADGALEVLAIFRKHMLDWGAADDLFEPEGDSWLGAAAEHLRSHPHLETRIRALLAHPEARHRATAASAPMPGRSGQTLLCSWCAIRFAPSRHCPFCGAEPFDLSLSATRRIEGLRALRRTRRAPGKWRAWEGGAAATATFGAVLVAAGLPLADALVFGGMGGAVATLAFALVKDVAVPFGVLRSLRPVQLELVGLARPETGEATRRVRGRVRIVSPVVSPAGRAPCAAFRVVGRGPSGQLDDGEVGAFEVRTEHEGPFVVEPGPAIVDVAVPAEPSAVAVGEELARFLRHRGELPPRETAVDVSEAVVREGDEVEVEGPFEQRVSGYGLRGHGVVPTAPATRSEPIRLTRVAGG